MQGGMRQVKPFFTRLLCLIVLVTSTTGAMARAEMAFGKTIEICTNGYAVSITLTASGQPVDGAHPCPECYAVSAGLPPMAFVVPEALGGWARVLVPAGVAITDQTTPHKHARGPPALI